MYDIIIFIYIGSTRYMPEYSQDVLIYVRIYNRPYLCTMFECNPKWDEIQTKFIKGQRAIGRQDVIAHVCS